MNCKETKATKATKVTKVTKATKATKAKTPKVKTTKVAKEKLMVENNEWNLKDLRNKIDKLSLDEKKELFKIVKEKAKYTQNKNGIFFNMSTWNQDLKNRTMNFIEFSDNNSEILQVQENIKNTLLEETI
jgi:hypothetical protein